MFVENHGAKNFVVVDGTVLVTANDTDSGVVTAEGTEKGGRLGSARKDPAVASRGVNDEQVADIVSLVTGNDFGSRVGVGVDNGAELEQAMDKSEIHVEHLAGFQQDLVDDELTTRSFGQVNEVASAAMHKSDR